MRQIDDRSVRNGDWAYNGAYATHPYCSECLMPSDTKTDYCPNRGALMDANPPKSTGLESEEDKNGKLT